MVLVVVLFRFKSDVVFCSNSFCIRFPWTFISYLFEGAYCNNAINAFLRSTSKLNGRSTYWAVWPLRCFLDAVQCDCWNPTFFASFCRGPTLLVKVRTESHIGENPIPFPPRLLLRVIGRLTPLLIPTLLIRLRFEGGLDRSTGSYPVLLLLYLRSVLYHLVIFTYYTGLNVRQRWFLQKGSKMYAEFVEEFSTKHSFHHFIITSAATDGFFCFS